MYGNSKVKRLKATVHNKQYEQSLGEPVAKVTERPYEKINVGTIGHVDYGKKTLTSAIEMVNGRVLLNHRINR